MALIFALQNMPTIGKVMELILARLQVLGEASGRSKIANVFGFHKNKKLRLADTCDFHPEWPLAFPSHHECECAACGDHPHVDYLSTSQASDVHPSQ